MTLKERLIVSQGEEKSLKNFVHECTNVYLYGAGNVAMQVASYLKRLNLNWDGFIVTDTKEEDKYLLGKRIWTVGDVALENNDGIIIAVGRKLLDEIKKSIKSHYPNAKILYLEKFSNLRQGKEYASDYEAMPTGFFGQFNDLNDIGKKFSTDKCSKFHDYLRRYELFLQYYKDKNFNLLELGVFRGESLATWNGSVGGYFEKAHIIGVDVDENCRQYSSVAEVILTDLSAEENILSLKETKPSIIIDAASHFWSHQIMALFLLWDCLPSGGIYIVEDIETSFPNAGFYGYDDAVISAYDVCSQIAEVATSGSKLRQHSDFADEINKIGFEVDMAVFIKGSCLLIKK